MLILVVGAVGYATVRLYLGKVEESTGHLHKLNELYLATIKALAMAIDAKDQVTHGHIRRVQVYAVGLAKALGVSDEPTLKGIEAGALLHDTGKIAVPEHILNKPGKLNAQEYERMKTHVTIGAEILSGIDFPYPVIPYVRHHHENWDGTGYPDRIAGEAIPLGARILSVVDCFDALTSDRPYRRALSTEAALDILRERSGTMYDPRVVDEVHRDSSGADRAVADAESPPAPAAADPVAGRRGRVRSGQRRHRSAAASRRGGTDDRRSGARAARPVSSGSCRSRRRPSTCRAATTIVLEPLLVTGPHAELFRRSQIRLSEGVSGWVAAHGQFMVNANPALDLMGPVGDVRVPLSSALVVPFAAAGGGRGAMAFYADARRCIHAR